jgi:NADH:ubiquinone reductase (H+-translocating)
MKMMLKIRQMWGVRMGNKKQIVILGAGYGGVHAAKILGKKYKKNDSIEITLIDRNPHHTLMTELHEVAGGRVEPESVKVELSKIFHKSKVKVVTEEVLRINLKDQCLHTEYNEYPYDYLVIGTGSEPAYFNVPGVKENGFSLWSLNDAIKIRHHIEDMFQKASKERNSAKRRAMLTFAVAGAGFTGIEMIGELVEWKKKLSVEYNVQESEVNLIVVEALGRILNILDENNAVKTEKYLAKHGVQILKNAPIVDVTPDVVKLKDGSEIPTNTLIWTCGVQGNSFCSNVGLTLTSRCRINANQYMQALDKENVYVVGDCAFIEEGASKTLPQIVEAALQTAETVAHNIEADINKSEKKVFKSSYHGFMVSVGSHYAVANLNGIKLSGFMAMMMKHLVNLHYLFGVGGFYLIIKYLCHEFFNIKDKRSFVGGHLSAKSPTIWLVILRLYIGGMWLYEGIKKVNEGWLSEIKIPMFLPDATSAASAATDAATSASQAATNLPTPLLSTPPEIFTSFMSILKPLGFYFQVMIVLAEIGIGLALIAGLFTFLASAASVFLCINFILSAMAGIEIIWYIVGSIALMGGAGRSFGLDYFIMPWLGKHLSNFWVGKQTPVYITNKSAKM